MVVEAISRRASGDGPARGSVSPCAIRALVLGHSTPLPRADLADGLIRAISGLLATAQRLRLLYPVPRSWSPGMRIAVIGLGNAGTTLHLPALAGLPDVTIAGAMDIDADRRAKAAERFKVPVFDAFDTMMATTGTRCRIDEAMLAQLHEVRLG